LLDGSEVKAGDIGDRLDMIVATKVGLDPTFVIGIASGMAVTPVRGDRLGNKWRRGAGLVALR